MHGKGAIKKGGDCGKWQLEHKVQHRNVNVLDAKTCSVIFSVPGICEIIFVAKKFHDFPFI